MVSFLSSLAVPFLVVAPINYLSQGARGTEIDQNLRRHVRNLYGLWNTGDFLNPWQNLAKPKMLIKNSTIPMMLRLLKLHEILWYLFLRPCD
jgi:hypothetical protein